MTYDEKVALVEDAIEKALSGFSKNEYGDYVALQAARIHMIAAGAAVRALTASEEPLGTLAEPEGTILDAADRVAEWLEWLGETSPLGAMSLQADDLRRLVDAARSLARAEEEIEHWRSYFFKVLEELKPTHVNVYPYTLGLPPSPYERDQVRARRWVGGQPPSDEERAVIDARRERKRKSNEPD